MTDIVLISILGIVMGIVTSISGGAGVFAIPTMLALGIPPLNTLALNRVSDAGAVLGAVKSYFKSRSVDWKLALIIMIPLVIGSYIGASTVVKLPEEILRYVILVGVFVGILLLFRKTNKTVKSGKTSISWIGLLLLLIAGIWSGAVAMAGATFAILVLVYFFGKSYLQARSTDIIAAIPETFISAIILAIGSQTTVLPLFAMFASSFVGAGIGSRLAIRHGSDFIRKAMIGVALLMIIKVVIDIL